VTFFQSCFVCSQSTQEEPATHTAAFADIISFFFCKKSAAHIKLKKLAFLPLVLFSQKSEEKKFTHTPAEKRERNGSREG
jgi:hypothetical protein